MNLKQLEAFLKLANNGSFSGTARELYLTQPTVSAHIQALEDELGVKLFKRNTKGTSLTDDGRKLYIYTRDIMLIIDNIKAEFKKEDESTLKNMIIASSSVPASYILPNIISNFSKQYPSSQFTIKESDSAGVVNEIINRTVDLGFTGTILDKSKCTYIPFCEDKLVIIMPNKTEYRNIIDTNKDFSWLQKVPIIMREDGSGTRKEAEKLLKKYVKSLDKLNIIAKMDNTDSIKRSVKNGLVISIVSELAAKDYVQGNGDKLLIYPTELTSRKFYIVYNSTIPLSSSAKILINMVSDLYRNE